MFSKKFWLTFILVFVTLEVSGYIIYSLIMGSTFQDPDVSKAFRPEGEMMSKMWIVYLMDLVWSFFFTFFFVKGYENRGIMEGIRFGIYIGLFFSMVVSYQSYVFYPLPYKVVLQMFLWGFVQSILCGIVAALVYKPKQQEAS
ncbi:MAG: hypothetical protein NUV92_01675 [Ignavibacteria bacterium]|nr:hypothetical protein [Ignavibacteria bacterium]MDH7526943.1 hypothetical protein [Ignavibacteria bacterium]